MTTKASKKTVGDTVENLTSGQSLETAKTTSFVENSPYENLMRGDRILVKKTGHVLNGNGAQADNIFVITGACEMVIWGEITAVTNSTKCSSPYLNSYDGTMTANITDPLGASTLSGCAVGDVFLVDSDDSITLGVYNCAQCQKFETDDFGVLYPFGIIAKTGTTTNIKFNFTGDANTNITATFYCRYKPITGSGSVVSA
jgi:hypothetical protein